MPEDDLDMSTFMGAFKEESQELVATVTEGLLKLEQTPDDTERLKEIARAVHTLKGNARLMGLDKINQLTHRLENMLVAMRDGQLPFTPAAADLVLDTLDLVSTASNNACETGQEGIEIETICDRIDQAAQGSPASSEANKSEATAEPEQGTLQEVPDSPQPQTEDDAAASPVSAAEPAERGGTPVKKKTAKGTGGRARTKRSRKKATTKTDSQATEGTGSEKHAPRKKSKTAPVAPTPQAATVPESKPDKATPPDAVPSTTTESRRAPTAETIRVDTGKLDGLANAAGEMIMNLIKFEAKADSVRQIVGMAKQHVRVWQQLRDELTPSLGTLIAASGDGVNPAELEQLINRCDNTGASVLTELERLSQQLNEDVMRVGTTTRMIEEDVLSIRMHPVSTLFNTFPRAVRDMARELGKLVDLIVEGGDTELDRKILEAIRDPLLHLVRNAVYHGIESAEERERMEKEPKAVVRLSAWQQGDQVFIQVADDGRGIDPAKVREAAVSKGLIDQSTAETLTRDDCLRLIFEPGFSTAATISDISGRGVGMDVVKVRVEEMHGEVRVESTVGAGTAVILALPLTLAISRAILIRTHDRTFAIPTASIETTVKVTSKEIKSVEGKEAIIVRNATVPIFPLSQILGMDASSGRDGDIALHILVISHSQQRVGFIVDELIGEQEIVVRPLGAPLKKVKNVAGAATLGSGEVVVVLHVPDIVAAARGAVLKPTSRDHSKSLPASRRKTVLVVEDSLTARELEKSMFQAVGYEVQTAIDGVEGLERLAEGTVDLIVTDIQMPRMDGFAMIRHVKSDDRYRNIPVIIVTTRSDEADRRRGLELGADAYLAKSSLSQSDLLENTRRLIG